MVPVVLVWYHIIKSTRYQWYLNVNVSIRDIFHRLAQKHNYQTN